MADDDLDPDQTDLVPRSHIRQLEEKAKRAGDLEAQLTAAQRDAAFARALGSTEHPARPYFEKGYDGELEVDAIRNAARDAGLFSTEPAPAATSTDAPTPGELAAHARMQAASEGAGGNKPIDLMEAFGPRGTHKPEEILRMARAAGRRTVDDMQ
jgi:hypothetical protein